MDSPVRSGLLLSFDRALLGICFFVIEWSGTPDHGLVDSRYKQQIYITNVQFQIWARALPSDNLNCWDAYGLFCPFFALTHAFQRWQSSMTSTCTLYSCPTVIDSIAWHACLLIIRIWHTPTYNQNLTQFGNYLPIIHPWIWVQELYSYSYLEGQTQAHPYGGGCTC